MRRTKIIATVGPACNSYPMLRRLVTKVDVFRINFSHGDRQSHAAEIRGIRRAAASAGRNVAILQDLPGPKIRVGKMRNDSVDLAKGSRFVLTSEDVLGDQRRATLNYPDLLKSVVKGDLLHLADGIIRLRVEENRGGEVVCTVLAGGVLSSGKGVNAPGVKMRISYPTEQDVAHLRYGMSQDVDYVALSFVRSASDVKAVRRLMGKKKGPWLVAKIEKKEAVEDFGAILSEAEGVMVARGDLGIEVPIEKMPVIQKQIIHDANVAGKPVIVATQMLVNMVNFPIPSRAEVTDVSTAVLDGADAVMLSDETAVGNYPVEAVGMLDRIAAATERVLKKYGPGRPEPSLIPTDEAIGRAACRLADDIGAKVIVAPTQSGSTARRVSKYRPSQSVVALCDQPSVARKLALFWGVVPVVSAQTKTTDENLARAQSAALSLGLARKGDRLVVTSGTLGMEGSTDLVKVITVGRAALATRRSRTG
jgi:pyruvate kinase